MDEIGKKLSKKMKEYDRRAALAKKNEPPDYGVRELEDIEVPEVESPRIARLRKMILLKDRFKMYEKRGGKRKSSYKSPKNQDVKKGDFEMDSPRGPQVDITDPKKRYTTDTFGAPLEVQRNPSKKADT